MKWRKTISSAWLEQYWLSFYHLQCSKKAACVGSAELKLRLEQAAQLEKYGLFLSTCFIDIFSSFLKLDSVYMSVPKKSLCIGKSALTLVI